MFYEILDQLKDRDDVLFDDLFAADRARIDCVITFLAILEMARLKLMRVAQMGTFEPIRLTKTVDLTEAKTLLGSVNDDFS